jgi:hypothetical protein
MDIEEIHNIYYSDIVQQKLKHNKKHFLDMIKNDPYMIVYNYNEQNVDSYIKENPGTTLLEFYNNVF